jgi:CHAD domain-containing protein
MGVPLGLDPSDHHVPLVAAAPAAAAAAALLERLWAVMAANEAGVRDQLDIEFLHDFRVAVRRARTIVRAAAGVLPDVTRGQLAAELKWLGDTTTPVRDLDVYLEGGPPQPELEPLWAVLDADRANAHAALVTALDSERYVRLGALVASVTRPHEAPPAEPSTAAWAHDTVRKAHKGLLRKGRAAAGPEELHEVRKAGKRLRYLLDAFAPVIGADAVRSLIKDLKALQDVLGALQDGAVHAELLTNVGARLAGAPAPTLIAVGRLVEAEHRRQEEAADAFAERFERFAAQRRRVKAALAALEQA